MFRSPVPVRVNPAVSVRSLRSGHLLDELLGSALIVVVGRLSGLVAVVAVMLVVPFVWSQPDNSEARARAKRVRVRKRQKRKNQRKRKNTVEKPLLGVDWRGSLVSSLQTEETAYAWQKLHCEKTPPMLPSHRIDS